MPATASAAEELHLRPTDYRPDSPLLSAEIGRRSETDPSSFGTIDFTASSVAWFRTRVPQVQMATLVASLSQDLPTGQHFHVSIYGSADAAEDGSSLTLIKDGSVVNNESVNWHYEFLPTGPWQWIYYEIELESGTPATCTFGAFWTAVSLLCFVTDEAHGTRSSNLGSVAWGSTWVGIRTLDKVVGRTRVYAGKRPAADDVIDAPDISGDPSIGYEWGPGTHQAGEPVMTPDGFPQQFERTTWHAFHSTTPGPLTFHDDVATSRSAVVQTAQGPVTGTVMAVYLGPPNASVADLGLLGVAAGDYLPSEPATTFDAAAVTVDSDGDTWFYIQHAYICDFDPLSPDMSSAPHQLLRWSQRPPMSLDDVVGRTTLFWSLLDLDTITGRTGVSVAPVLDVPTEVTLDQVVGSTAVDLESYATLDVIGDLDTVTGVSSTSLKYSPDIGDNPPINLQISLSGEIIVHDEEGDFSDIVAQFRHTLTTVVSAPPMIVVGGTPLVPTWLSNIGSTADLVIGAHHIRAEKPAPVWDGSGYVNPPPVTRKPWAARWVVSDLPDPGDGYYWLGDPSAADGTRSIGANRRKWRAHGSTPFAPAWRSRYPFKPSVRAADHYLPGGRVVHHPKGVHFNPEYIEHMYMNWGGPRRQPFTWVMATMIVAWPGRHYRHYLLDAGGGPGSERFPHINEYQTGTDRKVIDGVPYRTLMAMSDEHMIMSSLGNEPHGVLRTRASASYSPRMVFGVFNGAHSMVGNYSPHGRHVRRGRIPNTRQHEHRFYVLGRRQGIMSQDKATHMLLFEIRYWSYALDGDELADQYDELASTYHFNAYRRV